MADRLTGQRGVDERGTVGGVSPSSLRLLAAYLSSRLRGGRSGAPDHDDVEVTVGDALLEEFALASRGLTPGDVELLCREWGEPAAARAWVREAVRLGLLDERFDGSDLRLVISDAGRRVYGRLTSGEIEVSLPRAARKP